MAIIIKKLYLSAIALAILVLFGACAHEEIADLAGGTLKLAIGQISIQSETRATPSQIGKPVANRFKLKIQRHDSQNITYEGKFVESLEVKVGTYNITASCGQDVLLGKDSPYYLGTAQATVEQEKATSISIPCRVANALISVVFGSNEEEKQRFDRYYEDYGILVRIGNYSMAIEHDETEKSIYFRAGSSPTLSFYGKLKSENNRLVTCDLHSDNMPSSFKGADHAIVTLDLPDPESALNVDISKVELETVVLGETIPLSWLPVSTATATHQYNGAGELVGTNVTFSNTYPGLTWKAVVTNANDEEVRTITGQGELTSAYNSSSEWPYLPQGKYKATYYIITEESASKISSREFTVGQPELKVTVGGYSSYTKYLEGDIDAANACAPNTIYQPSVAFNISEGLLGHGKYNYSFSYTYVDATEQVAAGKNSYSVNAIENQDARLAPYTLKATASFDGISVEAQKDFYITGLPANYTPPTEAQGWLAGSDHVTFSANEVKLGHQGGITAHYNEYIYNGNIAIPAYTTVALDYDVMIHPATVGTTLTISAGNKVLCSKTQNGGAFNNTDYPHNGTEIVTLTENATQLKCLNSYGGGNSRSHIYSLGLKYSK